MIRLTGWRLRECATVTCRAFRCTCTQAKTKCRHSTFDTQLCSSPSNATAVEAWLSSESSCPAAKTESSTRSTTPMREGRADKASLLTEPPPYSAVMECTSGLSSASVSVAPPSEEVRPVTVRSQRSV